MILLSVIVIKANAQSYTRTIESNKFWYIASFTDGYSYSSVRTDIYKLEQDTSINSTPYYRLYVSRDSGLQNFNPVPLFFREDSAEEKIFILDSYMDSEKLYYDFNVSLNDTIETWNLLSYSFTPSIVKSIDTIIIQNSGRRRIKVVDGSDPNSTALPEYWIEGIGSTSGLIWAGADYFLIDASHNLNCVVENNETIYSCPYCTSCYMSNLGIANSQNNSQLKITPNPVTGESQLTFDGNDSRTYLLNIINTYGEIKSQFTFHGSLSIRISRNEFNSGLYIGTLTSNGNFEGKVKFIII